MQNRYGPNRVGPFGLFQPVADGIKSLTKEDIVPLSADAVVHFLAPVLLVVVVFMGYAVLPIGRNMTLVHMDAGLLFFFAIGASSELSVFMAGWSSRNKYSLLGAMRAVAQMISYEVPLLMSSVAVVMMTGSLFLGGYSAPLQVLGFVPSWLWFIAKVMLSMCVFIWVRGTLPRLRQDQLMNFAWKFVLPLTMLNLLVAGLWRFMGEGWLRWPVCSAILLGAYVLMARTGMSRERFGPRSYRYAE